MKTTILLLACAFLIAGCNSIQPCNVQSEKFLSEIDTITKQWDDANTLANSTPRLALPPVISQLQDARRQAEDIEVPECAATVKTALLGYMQSTIAAYLGFVSQEAEDLVKQKFNKAASDRDYFSVEYGKLKAGTGFYK